MRGVENYDHGSEREILYMNVTVSVGLRCALQVFSDQESAIEYVSSVNTKETPRFRLIADGLRSTMTEDIVCQS